MRTGLFSSSTFKLAIAGALFFCLFKFISPGGELSLDQGGSGAYGSGAYESCAVVIVDESENDRMIRESLAGIGDFISESSQEILIDDFGALISIPLDS